MPAVEEGVVARRRHGQHVADEEREVVVLPAEDRKQVLQTTTITTKAGLPGRALEVHPAPKYEPGPRGS